MIRSWEALQWFFLIFDFWGRGTGKTWSDFGSPFCCSRYILLSLIFSGALSCVYSIDPWSLLQTRALHQSYELRSFPSMPCNSLPSVRDPSPSACSRRTRLPDRTAKSHASVELNITFKTTDLHHPVVLKSRHHREYHWASPKSLDKSLAGNIYTLLSLLLFKNGWDRMQWALCWQHLHGKMM